jgi:hypothetical protein
MNRLLRTGVAVAALLAGAALANAQMQMEREGSEKGSELKQQPPSEHTKAKQERGYEGRSAAPEQPSERLGKESRERQTPTQAEPSERGQRAEEHRSVAPGEAQQPEKTVEKREHKTPPQTGPSEAQKPGAERHSAAPERTQQLEPQARPGEIERKGEGRSASPATEGTTGNKASIEKRQGAQGAQGGSATMLQQGRSSFGLSTNQENRVRETLINERSARVEHVDFDVTVGTVVPETIHFVPLPPRIARIVPRYRGYDYFVVSDEIVLVEPRTHRIAAVIPAAGRGSRC